MYKSFRYSVYAIRRTDTNKVLYIGHTYRPIATRLKAHVSHAESGEGPGNRWMEWIRNNPDIGLAIEEIASGHGVTLEAYAHERKTIEEFVKTGGELMNSNNGIKKEASAVRIAQRTGSTGKRSKVLRNTEYYGLFAA